MFEAQGIPTVTIGTDAFTDLLALEAEQRGLTSDLQDTLEGT